MHNKIFKSLRLKLVATFLTVFAAFNANAALLLQVDLSVENTISISATDGASLITASGSDLTGVYLEDFFAS